MARNFNLVKFSNGSRSFTKKFYSKKREIFTIAEMDRKGYRPTYFNEHTKTFKRPGSQMKKFGF